MDVALRGCFDDPALEVMNFLNEVVLRYPQAISFAPGRPAERHFDVQGSLEQVPRFVEHRAAESGWPPAAVWNDLGQYNRTNGIINALIARQLELDEGIRVQPESIIVTVGCQEAMLLLLLGLFEPGDALLVSDPTYIGITGLATVLGIPMIPIPTGERGLEPAAVAATIEEVRRSGRRPRAVYDIPDFNNPLGTRMSLEARRGLLQVAREHQVLIFEDNPYGMFSFDGEPLPTLKAMDKHRDVIYLGSFSKTLYPGLRAGYLVADQEVVSRDGRRTSLAAELSKIKSLTTVTSSPVAQAVAGALLLENGGSLRGLVRAKLPFYRANRDCMVASLDQELAGVEGVQWNRPEGGFFLTLSLPFEFDDDCLQACARDFGVIVCPMSFFSLAGGREREVRLSFSYVTPEQIEEGIRRFARFVLNRIAAAAATAESAAAGVRT
ncbi:MAG TPA: PLP-dependent aminotransferase family protein [Thermoanaerobaculia bacterium]|nr:PLP-dependent aminotransferase family protein [Thermoanaerobaculia bacterium]